MRCPHPRGLALEPRHRAGCEGPGVPQTSRWGSSAPLIHEGAPGFAYPDYPADTPEGALHLQASGGPRDAEGKSGWCCTSGCSCEGGVDQPGEGCAGADDDAAAAVCECCCNAAVAAADAQWQQEEAGEEATGERDRQWVGEKGALCGEGCCCCGVETAYAAATEAAAVGRRGPRGCVDKREVLQRELRELQRKQQRLLERHQRLQLQRMQQQQQQQQQQQDTGRSASPVGSRLRGERKKVPWNVSRFSTSSSSRYCCSSPCTSGCSSSSSSSRQHGILYLCCFSSAGRSAGFVSVPGHPDRAAAAAAPQHQPPFGCCCCCLQAEAGSNGDRPTPFCCAL